MKFIYNVTNNKVYCIAKYAGRSVRGVAKCHPEDTFDLEQGKLLARLRCEHKLAQKRLARANMRSVTAFADLARANKEVTAATKYQDDALVKFLETRSALAKIEESLS